MSGTSLDGLDVAYCRFRHTSTGWTYTLDAAETIRYPAAWIKKLATAHLLPAESLLALHAAYGTYLGEQCKAFITRHAIGKVDFIASHGHTVFHQPDKMFTFQLGSGHALHVACGIPVVFDFRSQDVAFGGQGAPLVPIGDHMLFHDYDGCLNLGGIANLSAVVNKKRVAFDVCYVNMALNALAQQAGKSFDRDGLLAADGELNQSLYRKLDRTYTPLRSKRPSLGREWFEKKLWPILDDAAIPVADRLYTVTESIAHELALAIESVIPRGTVLCTGGGTYNAHLLYRLVDHINQETLLVKPDDSLIHFKEALVFAFLGVLRVRQEVNCLMSVTGASRDHSSGLMIGFAS